MGERQSGGATPGRRRAHPDRMTARHPSAPQAVLDDAALEALLSAAVLRGHRPDAVGEQRAVAAFRAARAEGAHRARTRRRDDWRPRERRRLAMSARATLSLLLAGLTLGGVAVAAINSSGPAEAPEERRTSPSESASRPSAASSARPSAPPSAAPRTTARPGAARDLEAKCRAYGKVEGRGKALESTAWQRLVAAAGGEDEVAAYCADRLATAPARPGNGTAGTPATGKGQDGTGQDRTGQGGTGSGRGTPGQGAGDDGNAGNGNAGNGTSGNPGKNKG
ncbi:hypothetical protein [Streptomyces sp. NPDC054756]